MKTHFIVTNTEINRKLEQYYIYRQVDFGATLKPEYLQNYILMFQKKTNVNFVKPFSRNRCGNISITFYEARIILMSTCQGKKSKVVTFSNTGMEITYE